MGSQVGVEFSKLINVMKDKKIEKTKSYDTEVVPRNGARALLMKRAGF
jgi:hypothetical protein